MSMTTAQRTNYKLANQRRKVSAMKVLKGTKRQKRSLEHNFIQSRKAA